MEETKSNPINHYPPKWCVLSNGTGFCTTACGCSMEKIKELNDRKERELAQSEGRVEREPANVKVINLFADQQWMIRILKDYAVKLHNVGTINFSRDWEKRMGNDLLQIATVLEQSTEDNNTLYEFRYNSCIHESSWATISIHRTIEGAEKAMNEHKEKGRIEWLKSYPSKEDQEDIPFGMFEDWHVTPVEVKN